MAKVVREMVEKAGIDVDELLELPIKNAATEFTTCYYYTILRANISGLGGEGIKEIAETARIEDRNHQTRGDSDRRGCRSRGKARNPTSAPPRSNRRSSARGNMKMVSFVQKTRPHPSDFPIGTRTISWNES